MLAPVSRPGRRALRHHVDAVHAAGALGVVDFQLAVLVEHAAGGAQVDDVGLDVQLGVDAVGAAVGHDLAGHVGGHGFSWSMRMSSRQVPMMAQSERAREATQQLGQPSILNLNL